MAGAKTPDSVQIESAGSLTLRICAFSTANIDDGDTYSTGITSIVGTPIFSASKDPTAGGEGMNVAWAPSTGVLTFHAPEEDVTGTLYIYSRG